MNENLKLKVIGIDFNSASPEARAEYHLTQSQIIEIYRQELIRQPFFILATCNRTEIYFMNIEPAKAQSQFIETIFGSLVNQAQFYTYSGDEAWLHLLELAVGLKSMLVGETEILGQLQAAFQLRLDYGGICQEQYRAFDKIIAAARRIRYRTHIGGYSSSLYTLVVQELKKELAGLADQTALILGNGTIAQNLSRVFRNHELPTTILARGNGIKRHLKPQPVIDEVSIVFGYEHLSDLLRTHNLIVTATAAPHYILKPEYQELLSGKILIDLAFPRNIDPVLGLSGDCRLWDLEHFGEISKANRKNKAQAIATAQIECLSALERIKKKPARQMIEIDSIKLIG